MLNLGAVTEIYSNRRLVVDSCDGVVDYTSDTVVLKAGRLKITAQGADLKLKILTDSAAVVEGLITSVNFGYL